MKEQDAVKAEMKIKIYCEVWHDSEQNKLQSNIYDLWEEHQAFEILNFTND